MAIISSNIDDNDSSRRKKELRLVDSKVIPEEKRNNNLNLARPLNFKEFIAKSCATSGSKENMYGFIIENIILFYH